MRPSLLDPKVLVLQSPSAGTPLSSRAAGPCGTFLAALLDGAVALVSESSAHAGSQQMSLEGELKLIQLMRTVSAGARRKWAVLGTAERWSCSACLWANHPSHPNRPNQPKCALGWAASPGSAAEWGSFINSLVWFRQLVLLFKQHPYLLVLKEQRKANSLEMSGD